MTEKFQMALQNDREAIFAALRHPNPIARAQTVSKLMEHGVCDAEIIAAVGQMVDDGERALFDETVADVAKMYLSKVADQ